MQAISTAASAEPPNIACEVGTACSTYVSTMMRNMASTHSHSADGSARGLVTEEEQLRFYALYQQVVWVPQG